MEEARDKTLEETRAAQEKDITRLQKFKKWAKENLVGLSSLAINVAGFATLAVLAARKAIAKGAQGVSKVSKAVANVGKKVAPLVASALKLIAQILTWGAKGLAFLATNLWILAIAFAWFIYDQYK